jgi:hypothetical protein
MYKIKNMLREEPAKPAVKRPLKAEPTFTFNVFGSTPSISDASTSRPTPPEAPAVQNHSSERRSTNTKGRRKSTARQIGSEQGETQASDDPYGLHPAQQQTEATNGPKHIPKLEDEEEYQDEDGAWPQRGLAKYKNHANTGSFIGSR